MCTLCKYGFKHAEEPYLMTGFNLLQDFVVTNLFHVMKLLDLKRTQHHDELCDFTYSMF